MSKFNRRYAKTPVIEPLRPLSFQPPVLDLSAILEELHAKIHQAFRPSSRLTESKHNEQLLQR